MAGTQPTETLTQMALHFIGDVGIGVGGAVVGFGVVLGSFILYVSLKGVRLPKI